MDLFSKIEMITRDTCIILNATSELVQDDVYSEDVIKNINLTNNTLGILNEKMRPIFSKHSNKGLKESMKELGKYLEEINSCYKQNENNSIEEIVINELVPKFKMFYKELHNYFVDITGIKKAVVVGVNKLSTNIEKLIDVKKCEVVAFISDEEKFKNGSVKDISVFEKNEISFINYDYLIITEPFTPNIEEKPSINLLKYEEQYYDYEVFKTYSSYSNCKRNLDGFITGLSYVEVGIDAAKLSYKVENLAVSSQDLFYDYEWAKMILNNKVIGSKIKFAILGMSYYSFQYDLSKGSLKNRVYNYYPFFGFTRNHPYGEDMINDYIKFNKIASEIFKKDYNVILYKLLKEKMDAGWDWYISRVMTEDEAEKYREIVEKDCNKNYPETVKENTLILREYLSFLKSKKIRPIIVICPMTRYYCEKFSIRIKEEFRELIKNIQDEFDVEVLDYFESDEFVYEDFYDISHLNKNGAEKFTKLLNDKLKTLL